MRVDLIDKEPSNRVQAFWEGAKAIAAGFATTLRHLFVKPITEEYPEVKRVLPARTRARIVLTRDPDGGERCVACYLCSGVCPVSCISMQSAEARGRAALCSLVPHQLRALHLLRAVRGGLPDLGHPAVAAVRNLRAGDPHAGL